jgi:hypothetical protein
MIGMEKIKNGIIIVLIIGVALLLWLYVDITEQRGNLVLEKQSLESQVKAARDSLSNSEKIKNNMEERADSLARLIREQPSNLIDDISRLGMMTDSFAVLSQLITDSTQDAEIAKCVESIIKISTTLKEVSEAVVANSRQDSLRDEGSKAEIKELKKGIDSANRNIAEAREILFTGRTASQPPVKKVDEASEKEANKKKIVSHTADRL